MTKKVWLRRYKDTVKITEIDDPHLGLTPHRTAEHLPDKGRFVITYDKEDETICYIHSDAIIDGLELIDENTTIGEAK